MGTPRNERNVAATQAFLNAEVIMFEA